MGQSKSETPPPSDRPLVFFCGSRMEFSSLPSAALRFSYQGLAQNFAYLETRLRPGRLMIGRKCELAGRNGVVCRAPLGNDARPGKTTQQAQTRSERGSRRQVIRSQKKGGK
jgi:hypothetical protein